jgi:putative nucleotidyltransferase with HDIG domain
MNHRAQRVPAGYTLALLAGLSLGLGLSGLDRENLVSALLLLTMASIGEWLEVRMRPFGSFTLRPVFAFVGLWIGGPALLLLVGVLPALLVDLTVRRAPIWPAIGTAGRDALALWVGAGAYLAMSFRWGQGSGWAEELGARAAGLIAYWVVSGVLQALELREVGGVRFPAALGHLSRRAAAHVAVLSAAAIGLGYVESRFGLLVAGLAAITLVEAYYPWKLLGEQNGVLLTSLQMTAQAVDLKDPYTSNHSQRVSQYAVRLARAIGLPEDEVERIRIGGLMHDIGKIGVSGRIIRKPGKLTPDENALMRQHSTVSADIIEPIEILKESAAMVRHHHENWDGSGYPDGLKGEEIPLGARIIFVADAYDALVTDRPYRKGATRAEALGVIRRHAGSQFDPTVVAVMEKIAARL